MIDGENLCKTKYYISQKHQINKNGRIEGNVEFLGCIDQHKQRLMYNFEQCKN